MGMERNFSQSNESIKEKEITQKNDNSNNNLRNKIGKVARRFALVGGLTAATLGAAKYGDKIVQDVEYALSLEKLTSEGIVTGKEFIKAHQLPLPNSRGLEMKIIPQKWILHIQFDNKNEIVPLSSQNEFDSYSEGEKLNIIYQTPGKKLGSDAIKIVSIEKIK